MGKAPYRIIVRHDHAVYKLEKIIALADIGDNVLVIFPENFVDARLRTCPYRIAAVAGERRHKIVGKAMFGCVVRHGNQLRICQPVMKNAIETRTYPNIIIRIDSDGPWIERGHPFRKTWQRLQIGGRLTGMQGECMNKIIPGGKP